VGFPPLYRTTLLITPSMLVMAISVTIKLNKSKRKIKYEQLNFFMGHDSAFSGCDALTGFFELFYPLKKFILKRNLSLMIRVQ
jgi:hypothetical protein